MVVKPCVNNGTKLPISTGEFTGFLVAINSISITQDSRKRCFIDWSLDLVLEGSTTKIEDIHRFQVCIRDEMLASYVGIIVNHEIRIPIKQPGIN